MTSSLEEFMNSERLSEQTGLYMYEFEPFKAHGSIMDSPGDEALSVVLWSGSFMDFINHSERIHINYSEATAFDSPLDYARTILASMFYKKFRDPEEDGGD